MDSGVQAGQGRIRNLERVGKGAVGRMEKERMVKIRDICAG